MANKKHPMKKQADRLAKQGRYGDSMLVHMNPAEVDALRKTSPIGDLTINPQTGHPEAFVQFIPAALAAAGAFAGGKSKTKQTDESTPTVSPQASQSYSSAPMERLSRQLMDSYFNPEYGMINQQIPIPVQQIAGLSPQEIQARNLAGGLGGFGAQLAEAQDMYRQGSQAFDPGSAGLFADPQARALYEQSTRGYDPSMGQQFMDQDARRMMMGAADDIRGAGQGISGEVGSAQQQAAQAAARARGQTEMAGRDLRSAGQMGQSAAMQGIAGLAGTGDQYDPSSASSFMDPFNRDVIDAQQAEIARLGEKQKIAARDQAVKSGAFGGSRGAIAEAEIGRNVLQQQAKTGAELRSQGFQQAQQQAQQSFEQAQGRRQQAAQMTGSLGQAGAQTGISAAQQAANLGLSAEQLAQRGALEGGQLGLSGQQGIGSLAAQRAGIGQNLGSQFQSAQQLGSNVFGNQMNRMQGAASGMGGLTNQQMSNAMNAYQMTGANQRAGAQGIAGLGQQGQNMLTSQIGTLGGLGQTGRGIQQRGLDAQYKAGTQMADEPFMRLQRGFNVMGQGAAYMPTYTTGYGTGQQQVNTSQLPSTASRAMNALSFGSNFLPSDIRLKENVIKVDEVEPGVGWYTWDWNDTAKAMGIDDQTEGVIAQELKEIKPSAVVMADDGYYRVDYSQVKRKRTGVQ